MRTDGQFGQTDNSDRQTAGGQKHTYSTIAARQFEWAKKLFSRRSFVRPSALLSPVLLLLLLLTEAQELGRENKLG